MKASHTALTLRVEVNSRSLFIISCNFALTVFYQPKLRGLAASAIHLLNDRELKRFIRLLVSPPDRVYA